MLRLAGLAEIRIRAHGSIADTNAMAVLPELAVLALDSQSSKVLGLDGK